MTESELEYLRRRTAEELETAERSDVIVAAEIHRRLAMLYASRIAEMRAEIRDGPHRERIIEPEMVEPLVMSQGAAAPR